jgi:hypothetical protein
MSKPKRKRKSESAIVAEILARWKTPTTLRVEPEGAKEREASKKKRRGGGA